MKPSKGIHTLDFESDLEILWLTPGTLVEEVGNTLALLSSDRSEVVSLPSALATYHPDPEPHLRLNARADRLISQLTTRGLLRTPSSPPSTQLTRRAALTGATALAGGVAISLSLPLAAAASSVSRRPGFWATNEITIDYDVNLVDRSFPISVYLSVRDEDFPEIMPGNFEGYWQLIVDRNEAEADDYWGGYLVWRLELSPSSALHGAIADFEDSDGPAPEISGIVTGAYGDIPALFTFDQSIPYG